MADDKLASSDNKHLEEGSWVLVTGGSRGIGRGIVEKCLSADHNVVFTYNSNAELADEIVSSASDSPQHVHAIQADLAEEEGVKRLTAELSSYKNLHAVVHNAFYAYDSLLTRIDINQAKKLMQLAAWSFLEIAQTVLPVMSSQRRGRFVFISSIAAKLAMQGNGSYSASKAAGEAICRQIMVEYARRNITANIIRPGYVKTDLMEQYEKQPDPGPARSFAEVDDVASLVNYLISSEGIGVNGQTFVVDAGKSNVSL